VRRFVFCLIALATVGLAAGTAFAWDGYGNGGYYAPGYGYAAGGYARGRSVNPGSVGNDPHGQAVQRIMAAHSPWRYYTHPMSLMNGPPVPPVYPGWGYGY
jgi:hypothetical protein